MLLGSVLVKWCYVSQVLVPVSGGCVGLNGEELTLAQSWEDCMAADIWGPCLWRTFLSGLRWRCTSHRTRLVHNQQVAAGIKIAFVMSILSVTEWPLFDQEALVSPHEWVTITQSTWGCPFFFFCILFLWLFMIPFCVFFLKECNCEPPNLWISGSL